MGGAIWTPSDGDADFPSVAFLLHGEPWRDNDPAFVPVTGQTLTRINSIVQRTAQYKWQDGSIEFVRASSRALTVPNAANLQFGSGAFSIEHWFYRAASGVQHTLLAKGGASTGWCWDITSGNKLRWTSGASVIATSSASVPVGSWVYLGARRSGTTLSLYIGASQDGSGTDSANYAQTEELQIGRDRSAANYCDGYVNDVRITTGVARSMSVPAARFPDALTTGAIKVPDLIGGAAGQHYWHP